MEQPDKSKSPSENDVTSSTKKQQLTLSKSFSLPRSYSNSPQTPTNGDSPFHAAPLSGNHNLRSAGARRYLNFGTNGEGSMSPGRRAEDANNVQPSAQPSENNVTGLVAKPENKKPQTPSKVSSSAEDAVITANGHKKKATEATTIDDNTREKVESGSPSSSKGGKQKALRRFFLLFFASAFLFFSISDRSPFLPSSGADRCLSPSLKALGIDEGGQEGVIGLPPVVMAPGIGGSAFFVRASRRKAPEFGSLFGHGGACELPKSWEKLWFDPWILLSAKTYDCFMMILESTRESMLGRGAAEDLPVDLDTNYDFGGVLGVSSLLDGAASNASAYFGSFIQFLKSCGYREGRNVHGAPYDWRMAPDGLEKQGYFYRLKKLVETSVHVNGRPAVLVGHSYGGPILKYFLRRQSEEWRDRYVLAFVPVGAPFGGSVGIIEAIAAGNTLGAPFVSHSLFWTVQSTAPSGAWLSPHPQIFEPRDGTTPMPAVALTREANFSAAALPDFYEGVGHSAFLPLLRDVHKRYLDELIAPPKTRTFCIFGAGLPTVEAMDFRFLSSSTASVSPSPSPSDSDSSAASPLSSAKAGEGREGAVPSERRAKRLSMTAPTPKPTPIETLFEGGDGTVNARSLRVCERWIAKKEEEEHSNDDENAAETLRKDVKEEGKVPYHSLVRVQPLEGADHFLVLRDDRFHKAIGDFIAISAREYDREHSWTARVAKAVEKLSTHEETAAAASET